MEGLLDSVRVIESSLLGPAAISLHLADLGAEVIKVEPPQGDYVRQMTWPIVEGVSLMHLHINRGKHSVVLDLRTTEAVEVYLDLVRSADAVVEAMRPGALEKRGLGYERLREVNPRIVFCTISGYGMTGPYKDMPRSEEHTSELQSPCNLVCRLLLEKKKKTKRRPKVRRLETHC